MWKISKISGDCSGRRTMSSTLSRHELGRKAALRKSECWIARTLWTEKLFLPHGAVLEPTLTVVCFLLSHLWFVSPGSPRSLELNSHSPAVHYDVEIRASHALPDFDYRSSEAPGGRTPSNGLEGSVSPGGSGRSSAGPRSASITMMISKPASDFRRNNEN